MLDFCWWTSLIYLWPCLPFAFAHCLFLLCLLCFCDMWCVCCSCILSYLILLLPCAWIWICFCSFHIDGLTSVLMLTWLIYACIALLVCPTCSSFVYAFYLSLLKLLFIFFALYLWIVWFHLYWTIDDCNYMSFLFPPVLPVSFCFLFLLAPDISSVLMLTDFFIWALLCYALPCSLCVVISSEMTFALLPWAPGWCWTIFSWFSVSLILPNADLMYLCWCFVLHMCCLSALLLCQNTCSDICILTVLCCCLMEFFFFLQYVIFGWLLSLLLSSCCAGTLLYSMFLLYICLCCFACFAADPCVSPILISLPILDIWLFPMTLCLCFLCTMIIAWISWFSYAIFLLNNPIIVYVLCIIA